MTDTVVRDQLGFEILPGNIITYPVRQSSSLWMSFGVVRSVQTKPASYGDGVDSSVSVVVVAPKSWNDKTFVTRNTTMSSPGRASVVRMVSEENLPETSYHSLTQDTYRALRTIRNLIMENKNVPKELPPVSSGPDNGSVV